jgi:polyvinyl alcohol dehydrogenase (cytochrome)
MTVKSQLSIPAVALVLAALTPGAAPAAGDWASYGQDVANTRSQPRADLAPATVRRLRERWAVRHRAPDPAGATYSVSGTPAVIGSTAYVTDWTGRLSSIELATGRIRWSTKVSTLNSTPLAGINSSPAVTDDSVFVSAAEGRVASVARDTGHIRWSTVLDTHGLTTLDSSPVVAGDRVIVGVSSSQNFVQPPPYDFRGSIVALDVKTGRLLWQTYTMDEPGVGGSVWGTPAIDAGRGLAYVGTGQAYSAPAGPLNDALLALRLSDGSLAWHRQFTADDVWNVFGDLAGKDYDLGASPNLFRIGRRDVVGVGDKAGRYAVLDRATGATVWRRELCAGSHLGGVMTTAAVARGSIWLACNHLSAAALDTAHGDAGRPYFDWPLDRAPTTSETFRLDAVTGRVRWHRRVPGAALGALTEAGGVILVPNSDGTLRALDGRTGQTLWSVRPGGPVTGGAAVARGVVLVGYGVQFGGIGRALHPRPDAAGGVVAYATRAG